MTADRSVPVGPGTVLGQRYRLQERIAVGGMGQVWRGTDELLGRPIAVKILLPRLSDDETFRRRFREEAKSTAALVHPNIATLYDYGEEAGPSGGLISYVVMEMVEGEPLRAMLDREGRLSEVRTLRIVADGASALQVAHNNGLVHRDVKPANLLVAEDGTVKLTDFGIARSEHRVGDPLTDEGITLGTAAYLSPEQAAGRPATPRSDLYSLGVVAYECLAGHPPFRGESDVALVDQQAHAPPPPLPADVSEPVRRLVGRLLAKEPFDRPQSAAVVAQSARDLLGGVSPTDPGGVDGPAGAATTVLPAPVPPLPPRNITIPNDDEERRRARRRGALLVALVVVALALVVVVAALVLASNSGNGSGTVAVPPLTDLQASVAEVDLTTAGLHYKVDDVQGHAAVGTVVGQDPSAGTVVATGTTVTLSVVGTSTPTTPQSSSTSSTPPSSSTSTSSTSTSTSTTTSTTSSTSTSTSSSTTTSTSSSTSTSTSTSTSSTTSTTTATTSPTTSST